MTLDILSFVVSRHRRYSLFLLRYSGDRFTVPNSLFGIEYCSYMSDTESRELEIQLFYFFVFKVPLSRRSK